VSLVERLHEARGHSRRAQVLSRHFSALIPDGSTLLDVGCGDGLLDRAILDARSDLQIRGVDVLARPASHIPVKLFDGLSIPHESDSFDGVLLVDVLHHSDDAPRLLREAARVARKSLFIKDHTREGWLAEATLRFMDDVGNARHGVSLPYNYWSLEEWKKVLGDLQLPIASWSDRIGLYPWPASWLFDRSLHFIARLDTSARKEPA
jgi:SAM-dependent methyltransferase